MGSLDNSDLMMLYTTKEECGYPGCILAVMSTILFFLDEV
jgi:hypothetical protein